MRRKKIKFSPKLQSSSLDDVKRFVNKDALNTPVISSYNNLPTSYQNGGLPKYQTAGLEKPIHKIPKLSQIKTEEEYQDEERKRKEERRDLNPLNWRKNISDINTTGGYGLDFQDFIDQAIYPSPMKPRGPQLEAESNAFKIYMGQEQVGENRFEPSPWKEGAYHLPKYAKEFPDHIDKPDEWFERAGHYTDKSGRGFKRGEEYDFSGPTIKPYSDLVFGRHGVKKVPTKDGGFYLQYNDEWDLDAQNLIGSGRKQENENPILSKMLQKAEKAIFNPFPVEGRVYYGKDNNKITGKPLTFGGNNRATPLTEFKNGGLHRYQNGGAVVTDYDKNWDYKKEDGVVYTKRKDAEKWISPKVGSAAELAIQSKVFGSPSELEEAVQMPIPESPNLNVAPPQAIGDTIQSVAPLPMDMAPTAPTERMLPEMSMPDISMPDVSMPDIDMPDLSLSEKLLQAQGMLGSLWEGAKDVGGDIMDDVASAGSTVSSFLQDRVEDINEEVTDAIKFKKEAEETVAAKSQQISNYLSDIFTPDSEEAEPISPEQAPAEKSRTEAFAEMLRGSVPDMPELSGSPVDALMNPIGLTVGLPVAGAMGLYDKLKGIEVPDLPDVTLPKMQMPDVSVPDLPDMPDLPDVSMPDLEVPKVSLPDMPDISMPDMPDVGAFTGYAKEVISDAVESGQSSLSDLKNFFKGELIDYAEDFKETGENIKEGINSVIDAAKDLPELLNSIADVEKEVKKERGDSGAPGPPPEVEPDLVLSPEDAAPKETFEEMLVRGANSLHTGHILAGDVMYRVEGGEITKKMETIVGKNTTARKGAPSKLSYATTIPKFWYNDDGSLREFETEEGLKTGPEIKKEDLFNKYSGGTPAGIYKFTNEPPLGYENKKGYSSRLEALPGTPENATKAFFTNEKGERRFVYSSMAYHQYPGEKAKVIRDKALKDLNISNELSGACLQNMECDNEDMGILLESNPSFRDSLVVIVPSMGELSRAAVEGFAKRFDNAETKEEQGKVLQRLQALATFD